MWVLDKITEKAQSIYSYFYPNEEKKPLIHVPAIVNDKNTPLESPTKTSSTCYQILKYLIPSREQAVGLGLNVVRDLAWPGYTYLGWGEPFETSDDFWQQTYWQWIFATGVMIITFPAIVVFFSKVLKLKSSQNKGLKSLTDLNTLVAASLAIPGWNYGGKGITDFLISRRVKPYYASLLGSFGTGSAEGPIQGISQMVGSTIIDADARKRYLSKPGLVRVLFEILLHFTFGIVPGAMWNMVFVSNPFSVNRDNPIESWLDVVRLLCACISVATTVCICNYGYGKIFFDPLTIALDKCLDGKGLCSSRTLQLEEIILEEDSKKSDAPGIPSSTNTSTEEITLEENVSKSADGPNPHASTDASVEKIIVEGHDSKSSDGRSSLSSSNITEEEEMIIEIKGTSMSTK